MHILFFLYNKWGFNIFISSVNSFKPALTVTLFANLIKIPNLIKYVLDNNYDTIGVLDDNLLILYSITGKIIWVFEK